MKLPEGNRVVEILHEALRVLRERQTESVERPELGLDMEDWTTMCGTVHCVAGWMALDPWFKTETGLFLNGCGSPGVEGKPAVGFSAIWSIMGISYTQAEEHGIANLFYPYRYIERGLGFQPAIDRIETWLEDRGFPKGPEA